MRQLLLCAAAAVALASSALAGVIITGEEVGGDVVFSGGGTLNTSAWTYLTNSPQDAGVNPTYALFMGTTIDAYHLDPADLSGPATIGPGTLSKFASSSSGDAMSLAWPAATLGVPVGYVSGDPLNGSSTYAGETIASLGIAEGTYTWTWGSGASADYFTINIVPEPGTAALLSLAGLLFIRRRRGWSQRRGPVETMAGARRVHG